MGQTCKPQNAMHCLCSKAPSAPVWVCPCRRGPSSATATPHGEMLTKCLLKVGTWLWGDTASQCCCLACHPQQTAPRTPLTHTMCAPSLLLGRYQSCAAGHTQPTACRCWRSAGAAGITACGRRDVRPVRTASAGALKCDVGTASRHHLVSWWGDTGTSWYLWPSTVFGGVALQVVMRAFQQLPASLHHCLLLMLAHAAGLWHADVVTAAQAAAPVAAHTALVCLRQLASSVEFDASCISACLSSLCVGGPCKAHLHDSMCLLMAAICHKCGELAADPPAALLSALQHLATQPHIRHQQRQQQPMGGGSSSSASAVRNKSVELPPAPDDRGDGSLQPAMVQLQVWCIQELQQAGGCACCYDLCPRQPGQHTHTGCGQLYVFVSLRCADSF